MAELVALKVKIGLHAHGAAKYPDFGQLPIVKASGADWSHWIDANGSGWHYSKCGHKEHEDDSPFGEQWGMLLIPAEFATQAVAMFPEQCSVLNDVEAGEFYEQKCCRDMPEVKHDVDTLNGMAAEITLLKALSENTTGAEKAKHVKLLSDAMARAAKAIDPDHDAPGIKKNVDKSWDSHKAKRGYTVK